MFMLRIVYICCFLCSNLAYAQNSPHLGTQVDAITIAKWNLDIFPDGTGLPKGNGSARQGKLIYQQHCLSCHGVEGSGDSAEELAGAQHGLTDDPPDKTIGTYWPYATTVFDFTRRSMPLNAPGSLSNNQLYGVTAYLLFLNGIVSENQMMNAQTLPKVKMPNRFGFVNAYKVKK